MTLVVNVTEAAGARNATSGPHRHSALSDEQKRRKELKGATECAARPRVVAKGIMTGMCPPQANFRYFKADIVHFMHSLEIFNLAFDCN